MTKTPFPLKSWPLPTVRLECNKCGESAEMDKEMLISLYGEEIDMIELTVDLSQTYCDAESVYFDCKARLADADLAKAKLEQVD